MSSFRKVNSATIIYFLLDVMKVNLSDNTIDKHSQEEYEVAQHLSEMIISLFYRKQFEYKEETTLDLAK